MLGTPRLLAWCEAATCAAIEPALARADDQRRHPGLPRAPGRQPGRPEVEVTASTAYVDGRLHRFTVAARHTGDGKVVGTGEVTRVVVDAERFLSRLG